MIKRNNIDPQAGVLTNTMDTKSDEFKELQLLLRNKANPLSKRERIDIEILSLKILIEDYLSSNEKGIEIITVGDFLRMYLERLDIKQKELANYIGLKPSNFSKLLSGSRKVNFELSFKLSKIFKLDPKIWMLIQVKNDYMNLKKAKKNSRQKYKLEDLVNME